MSELPSAQGYQNLVNCEGRVVQAGEWFTEIREMAERWMADPSALPEISGSWVADDVSQVIELCKKGQEL